MYNMVHINPNILLLFWKIYIFIYKYLYICIYLCFHLRCCWGHSKHCWKSWSLIPSPVLFPLDHSSHSCCSHLIGFISKLVSFGRMSSFSVWHIASSFYFPFLCNFASLLSISPVKPRPCRILLWCSEICQMKTLPLRTAHSSTVDGNFSMPLLTCSWHSSADKLQDLA